MDRKVTRMMITMKVRRAILALLLALGLTLAATGNAEAGGNYTVHYCASSSWCYNVGQSMTVHIYRK
jgi:hypothetical protein